MNFKRIAAIGVNVLLLSFLFLRFNHPTLAYTTGMAASVVVGQSSFTTSSSGATASTLNYPQGMTSDGTRLFVSDSSNSRVLIWNTIPKTNGVAADVVVGQSNFTSVDANQGGSAAANTLNGPTDVFTDGKRLIIGDGNNRVLIFNAIPTSNNASADIVIGQTTMTGSSGGTSQTQLNNVLATYYDTTSGKLIITDFQNHRVLIYNRIPTANGAAADVVVGQPNFTSSSSGTDARTMNQPYASIVVSGKLLVAERSNHRVLIYNSIPTSNGAAADIVIGQQNFTSGSSNQGGSVGANTLFSPVDLTWDGKRLFVQDDDNNRILVFNGIPTSNNASANLVFGQTNFTSRSANQGLSSPTASTLSDPYHGLAVVNNQLFTTDSTNNRVLIYNNIINNPGLTLNNNSEGAPNNKLRHRGTTTLDSSSAYTIQSVDYLVNGGGWNSASASDGNFNSTSEAFFFDFDPKSNNNKYDGYTLRVRSTNSNLDITDTLFFFQPFAINGPVNDFTTTNPFPPFDFSVNKQHSELKDNLLKYQLWVSKGGSSDWKLYVDNIPLQPTYSNNTTTTDILYAQYTDNDSHLKVNAKDKTNTAFEKEGKRLSGTYQWKVVAVDKLNHSEETEVRTIHVDSKEITTDKWFPLSVLTISGLGNPNLSTVNQNAIKDTYTTSTTTPIFYGIAFSGSKVTLELTDQDCTASNPKECTKTFSTTANPESRFGINIPPGVLTPGKSYTTRLSVSKDQNYNEFPPLTLAISGV